MGTDIHLYVEEKHGLTWDYEAGQLFVWRDYDVFSRLCGMRKQEPWRGIVSEARGLPESVSDRVRYGVYGRNGDPTGASYAYGLENDPDIHTISWISDQEFTQEFAWMARLTDMPHFAVVCYPFIWRQPYPVRFVFGFDC